MWIIVIPLILVWPIIKQNIEVIAIVVALVIFLLERYYERRKDRVEINDRLERCYKTIEKELNDHEQSFDNPKYENSSDNENVPWKGMVLNIDAYDSLVHSGLFTYFQDRTQDRLANLYIRIKLQNKMIHEKTLVKSMFFMQGFSDEKKKLWPYISYPYDFSINGYQTEIENLLDDVKKLIIGEKNRFC